MKPVASLVRLLDADPDLAVGLDEHQLAAARDQLLATLIRLPRGPIDADASGMTHAPALLLDGIAAWSVVVEDRSTIALLGRGDLVPSSQTVDLPSYLSLGWHVEVLEEAHVAVVDDRVLRVAAQFPCVLNRLLGRTAQQRTDLAVRLAIGQMPSLDRRLMALFWYIADRWGIVTRDGVVLPNRLSHSILAGMASARRPSVTAAITRLVRQGKLCRLATGGWVLLGEPTRGSDVQSSAAVQPSITAR